MTGPGRQLPHGFLAGTPGYTDEELGFPPDFDDPEDPPEPTPTTPRK